MLYHRLEPFRVTSLTLATLWACPQIMEHICSQSSDVTAQTIVAAAPALLLEPSLHVGGVSLVIC
jgi:hypothetical protein